MARTIAKGELVMIDGGEYSSHYVTGVFRATRDLDLDVLESEFLAQGPEKAGERATMPEILFNRLDDDAFAENFQVWLMTSGAVEPAAIKTLTVQFHRYNGAPWTFGNTLADGEVSLVPEPEDSPRP